MRDLEARFPKSLVVIGVHSPKFTTERDDAHVREAIMREHLDHPVVNDSRMTMWRALGIEAWPTVLLVDPDGYVVKAVAGEGVEKAMLPVLESVEATYRSRGTLDEKPLSLALEAAHASSSLLSFPGKIVADDKSHRLFLSDSGHNRLLVASLDGQIQDVVGSGREGRDDGPYARATFRNPQGIALVGQVLYVADTDNHCIRAVDLKSRTVTTVAGTGRQAATEQEERNPRRRDLSSPWDLTWLDGALYVAMAGDHRIWRFVPSRPEIGVYAGSGEEGKQDGALLQAAFAQPSGIATDGHRLYVADSESSTIRQIDPRTGQVATLAGGDLFDFGHQDAPGPFARFQHPLGIAYARGRLYIADTYNNDIRVLTLSSRDVGTVAGSTVAGQGDGPTAGFFEPSGIAVLGDTLMVADTGNGVVRRIRLHDRRTETLVLHPER